MSYRGMDRGDPGFFGSIGKAIGKVAKVATNFLPGPVGAIARTVVGAVSGGGGSPSPVPALTMPGGSGTIVTMARGMAGAVTGAAAAAGRGIFGRSGKKIRRMNVSNSKAARRAIRRIKGARDLLRSIEREMPKRPCTRLHRKK